MTPNQNTNPIQIVDSAPSNIDFKTFNQNEIFQSNKVFIAFFLFLTLITFLIINEIKKNRINRKMHHDKQMMSNYIDTLEKMQLDIQKVQHDYKNMLIGINGFLEDEEHINISELKIFLEKNKLIQNEVQINSGTFIQLKNINVIEIKGLVSTKVAFAIQNGIQVSIECQESIIITKVDTLVLARILGIMMDNAIEECKKMKNSKIRMAFVNNHKNILIILSNTCQQKTLSIDVINMYGVSDKGENRGFGLGNLKQLTFDHPNLSLETTCADYWFTQKLFIGK